MLKIYVGCGLTHVPENFKQQVQQLKEKLKNLPSVLVLEFLGTSAGTDRDVYIHDIINCVCECDIMLAICDYPSTGLGWEMATQVGRGKPMLAFGHRDSTVTRLILDPGIPNYHFYRYETFEDIYEVVVRVVKDNHT